MLGIIQTITAKATVESNAFSVWLDSSALAGEVSAIGLPFRIGGLAVRPAQPSDRGRCESLCHKRA